MSKLEVETIFIVGAGFSYHAGLPLTSDFTEAILEARDFGSGPSRVMVDFLGTFIQDAFNHSPRAKASRWPELEDIFTCIDLSANSGHHLGSTFAPADLRTLRRAILSRIIRMLDQKYKARKKNQPNWKKLDDFFMCIGSKNIGFVSMNWDTVVERKLNATQPGYYLLDYCCDAAPAKIPDSPARDEFSSNRAYLKALKESQTIVIDTQLEDKRKADRIIPIVKIHGSANWLYCDNCRRLFCFPPDELTRIADQLVSADDLRRIGTFLRKTEDVRKATQNRPRQPLLKCVCSDKVVLATRIATFSYRKALDFPMFQKSWSAAEGLLRSANRWVFIGYSLPAADYEFKYLLKRTQLSRRQKPEFIVVTGGNQHDVSRTYDNYRKFFGRGIKKKLNFFTSGLSQEAIASIFA